MKTLILKYVSRNLDVLIDFLNGLDDQIDAYVKKQEAQAASYDQQISVLIDDKDKVLAQAATARNLQSKIKI